MSQGFSIKQELERIRKSKNLHLIVPVRLPRQERLFNQYLEASTEENALRIRTIREILRVENS